MLFVSYAQEKIKGAHTKEKITPRLIQIFLLSFKRYVAYAQEKIKAAHTASAAFFLKKEVCEGKDKGLLKKYQEDKGHKKHRKGHYVVALPLRRKR